jgi:hypothetical protein
MNSCGVYKIIVLGAGPTQHHQAIIGLLSLIDLTFFLTMIENLLGFKQALTMSL